MLLVVNGRQEAFDPGLAEAERIFFEPLMSNGISTHRSGHTSMKRVIQNYRNITFDLGFEEIHKLEFLVTIVAQLTTFDTYSQPTILKTSWRETQKIRNHF